MDSMFDILSDIPLFRGVTRERIAETVGTTRFHFLKYSDGEKIALAGSPCTHILIVLSGMVDITISNIDGRFVVSQKLTAPDVISPDFLFGPVTIYPGDVTAVGEVSIIRISKNDYMKILSSDNIFLYNFLNYLSMNAQKCVEGVLSLTTGSIEERLAMWVVAMTQPGAQDITVTCRQRDLNAMFGVPRSQLLDVLDSLAKRGVITFVPGRITVLDRRAMLEIMRNGLE